MAKSKLEQLKALSPLAAAIAFSASLPAQAQDFIVDVDVTEGPSSQDQLNTAINFIDSAESGDSHTITFTSGVTGGPLFFNGFDIYNDGSLTIDASATTGLVLEGEGFNVYGGGSLTIIGGGAEDFELILQEGVGFVWSSINVADEGSLVQFDNLALTIETSSYNSYSDNPSISASGYAQLNMNNVTIDVNDTAEQDVFNIFDVAGGVDLVLDNVHLDGAYEAEGMRVERSDVTISNSSFTGMPYNGQYDAGIEIYNGGGKIKYISITDTTFNDNESSTVLSIDSYNYYSSLDVTLENLVFQNNASREATLSLGKSGGDYGYEGEGVLNANLNNLVFDANSSWKNILSVHAYGYRSGDQELNITLTNSTFSNNEGEGAIVAFSNDYSSEGGPSTFINAFVGNVTLANNTSVDGTVLLYTENSYSNSEINLAMAHVTMASNGPLNEFNAYSGLVINNEDPYSGNIDINVDIINSIFSGNTGVAEEGLDTNIYSNIDINIDSSLIGALTEAEGSIQGLNNLIGKDPMLNELADNGGFGLTMLPKADSPVIDAGDDDFAEQLDIDLSLLFDQREEERIRGAAPDMGAVEVVPADEEPTEKKPSKKKDSDDGLLGSIGFGSLMAMFGLVGLRRKRK